VSRSTANRVISITPAVKSSVVILSTMSLLHMHIIEIYTVPLNRPSSVKCCTIVSDVTICACSATHVLAHTSVVTSDLLKRLLCCSVHLYCKATQST
jgi:hypothetical protein